MKEKIFKKRILILIIIISIISNVSFSEKNKNTVSKNVRFDKDKVISEINKKIDEKEKLNYYSENEIRNELKKAGVNNKSIEAFITANNNSKKENFSAENIKEDLLKAVKFDSKNYLALDALGEFAGMIDTVTSEAIPYYEKAIKVNPNFEKGYEHLLWAYSLPEKNEFAEKGKALAEKAVKLFPENPKLYENLYEYYRYYKKDYNKAVELGEKVIELYSKKNSRYYNYENFFRSLSSYSDLGDKFSLSLLDSYLEKGNDKATFDFFFKKYENIKKANEKAIKDYFSVHTYNDKDFKNMEESLKNIEKNIKILNEKYKNTDKKLYEENLKRFKNLGL